MKVKFCENNKGKDAVITMITETHPNIKISTKKCLGKCHRCKSRPIALVDKKILVGTDEENLYDMIISKLLIP
ncbi:MAG: YuzB family protein [Clostridiaceae bacterium]|nr:YuzB family protein [Clostridiaceae bacterium]